MFFFLIIIAVVVVVVGLYRWLIFFFSYIALNNSSMNLIGLQRTLVPHSVVLHTLNSSFSCCIHFCPSSSWMWRIFKSNYFIAYDMFLIFFLLSSFVENAFALKHVKKNRRTSWLNRTRLCECEFNSMYTIPKKPCISKFENSTKNTALFCLYVDVRVQMRVYVCYSFASAFLRRVRNLCTMCMHHR